ncbi:hypothetical protein [Legionella tunisiensis]|nr:hypothetical protein [Legionella tunisiensis]
MALSVHKKAMFSTQIRKSQISGFISKPFTREEAAELMNLLEQNAL